ncbi:MAG: hypothetical protein ACTHJ6_02650 [Oryzihumus sp.]
MVEFDGLVRYRGDGGSDVVVAEKLREDRIRSIGYEVLRVTWRELDRAHDSSAELSATAGVSGGGT